MCVSFLSVFSFRYLHFIPTPNSFRFLQTIWSFFPPLIYIQLFPTLFSFFELLVTSNPFLPYEEKTPLEKTYYISF